MLIPADEKAFKQEALAEQSDVALVALLGTLTRSVEEMKEVQRMFGVVEAAGQREGTRGGDGGRDIPELGRRSGVLAKESSGLGGTFVEGFNLRGLMRAAAGGRG